MSGSHHFRAVATAVTSFYPVTTTDTQPIYVPKKKKRSRGLNRSPVSLELVRNLSTDFATPHQLAANGDLENLKSFLETFGITIKERDENRATLLHHATVTNQIEVMKYLIDSGIELNAVDKNGHTALHVAVLQGHAEATNLLLESGINDTILNKDSDAALHIVARNLDTRLLSIFLEHPNIDLVVHGYRKRTPLHVMAELDNVAACDVLHSVMLKEHFKNKAGFRLCAADEDDLTPIHLAARKGAHRVLDLFMNTCKSHGYPPEVVLGFIDEENSTPLHAAIDGGFTEVVEVLLKHGADPVVNKDDQVPPFLLACSQGKFEMIKILLKSNNSEDAIKCEDVYGQSCLHHCARAINSSHIMPYLVHRGAKVNSTDNRGQTPMMISIIAGSTTGVNTLLELGADMLIKDIDGKNALHHAVTRNRKNIVTLLLERPYACTLVVDGDKDHNSPIHHALKSGLSSLVCPMISVIRSKLKNIKDCDGNNYLHLAANGGNLRALSILLEITECLQLLNETNKHGGTPLHSAASFGHLSCAELLLSHGAMTHKCYNGYTPFMCAAYRGHPEVARVLFNAHPFQLKWTNDKGCNALHLAAIGGNPQVIKLLLDIGVPITHNFEMESFFDMLILKNHVKGAAAAIEHDRYKECLDLVSPVHSHPMINLIIHMPEIARKVLDRSRSKADLAAANPDYWESFDFKYLRLTDFSKYSRPVKEEVDGESDDTTKPMLADEKETMQTHVIKYKGSTKQTQRNFSYEAKDCPKLFHLKTLRTMIKYDRGSLLTHPVSNAYLKSKWSHYGRWIHIILSSFVFFQVLFLSIFTVAIPNPSQIQANLPSSGAGCGNDTNGTAATPCLEFGAGANVCRFITIAFALLNLVIWLFTVIQLRLEVFHFINNIYILVDCLSVGFTIYYLIPTRGLNNANWEGGAIAVFFAWFSLVLKIQLFDLFGVYVTMFLAITRRAFQVLLICFLFVMSFGLSFYILTGNLKQYSTLGYSLFVNFGHLLGEIDYEEFVAEDVEGNLNFHWLTFMFVVILAILMSIVIMNLLIGLAVGDIDEIRTNAIAEKKMFEVKFFCKLDTIIPSRFLWYLDRPSVIKYPNRPKILVRRFWHFFWLSLKGGDPSLSDDDTSLSDDAGLDHKSSEVSRLKEKVEEFQHSQLIIQQTLTQMKAMQDNMMKLILAANREREESPELAANLTTAAEHAN